MNGEPIAVVGEPIIVATLPDHAPDTPAGSPPKVAPVAEVVAYVIFVIGVLTRTDWLFVPTPELRVIVLSGLTVIVPFAVIAPQPPVKVTV